MIKKKHKEKTGLKFDLAGTKILETEPEQNLEKS